MMPCLSLHNLAQLKDATIEFGDLTVFVGPQATGKSIALQTLKLAVDTGLIQDELRLYGLDWSGEPGKFLDIYYGDGMRKILKKNSLITWNNRKLDLAAIAKRQRKAKDESLFYIPAQRVLTLRDGWPRPFSDYAAGDPYTVRGYSERLRLLMEQETSGRANLFPRRNLLKKVFRDLIQRHVFSGLNLSIDRSRPQKRLLIGNRQQNLPYMVWSAGQREFVPLLLGLYWLMPPGAVPRRESLEWVVIEEPEMGLHSRANSVVLLLVLELLHRGYRVCLSTHSPQVLDMVWALNHLRAGKASSQDVLQLFDVGAGLSPIASAALKKDLRVYYFDRESRLVTDISNLDPGSDDETESYWGGLSEFSERANAAVAHAAANNGTKSTS